MVETYIVINEDNKIERVLMTADGENGVRRLARKGTKLQRVPESFAGKTGDDIAIFDELWNMRPLSTLVEEGLVEEPEGKILNEEGNAFRPATEAELVEKGRKKLEPWEVVDGDEVRGKNIQELYEDDLLTSEEKKKYIETLYRSQFNDIDRRTIRPMRAILAGLDTKKDRDILKALEEEARDLRLKAKKLNQ